MANPTPLERFVWFVKALTHAVVTRNLYFQVMPQAHTRWVIERLMALRDKLHRLARRIEAGTYRPRKGFTRRPADNPRPRPEQRVPRQRGWLAAHLPEAGQLRAILRDLINDAETQKLIAAAPVEMRRILGPACWMLDYRPPNLPALPRRRPAVRRPPAPRTKPPETGGARPAPPAPAIDPQYDVHPWLGPSYRRNA